MSTAPTSFGAQDFYRDLHLAFDATLARTAGQPSLVDALLGQAFDSFHGNVPLQCEDEPALACQRGCGTCCSLRVAATAPEVWLMARYLRALAPRLLARGVDLLGRAREANAATCGLSEPQRVALNQPCAFVAQGVCAVYPVRTLACRGHASSDAQACADAALGRCDQVPHSPGHRLLRALVQNAMQSSLRSAGLAWGLYELNQALVIAADHPNAEAAWLAGEDVLAPAALHEVPAAEMAAVFDRLRPTPSH